jgi:hypothetical protein
MTEPRKGASAPLMMFVATACSLVYFLIVHRDFTLLSYPFKFPDSWDWLVDSLSYLGCEVIPPVRAPITPLTFAALLSVGADDLIPYVGIFYHHLMIPGVYILTRTGTGCSRTALWAGVLCLVNSRLLGNALYIGSDVAANALMLYAVLFFWLGVTRNRRYLWLMSLFWGASALTQYAAFFLVFPLLGFILLFRRRLLRDSRVWASFVVAGVLASTQFVFRLIEYGNPLYSNVTHLGLLRPHFDTAGPYLWWSVGFFSPLVLVLALVGLWRVVRSRCLHAFGTLLALLIGTMAAFFVLLYDWPDNRFILYWAPAVLIFAAIGLAHCVARLLGESTSRTSIANHSQSSSIGAFRGRKVIATLLVLCTLVSGSLAAAHPFAGDVVLSPGVALVPTSDKPPLAPGGRTEVHLRWSSKRYQCFYYSHARAIRAFSHGREALACSFNDATMALRGLAPAIQAGLPVGATIEMLSASPGRAYWERNTLSFLTRRAVVAWEGLGAADGGGRDRPAMLVTYRDMGFSEQQLVEQGDHPTILTLHSGEKIQQRMTLPDGTAGIELLTGTFDRKGVALNVTLNRVGPDLAAVYQGDAQLRNNERTMIVPETSDPFAGGPYLLTLENRGELAGAVYVNDTVAPNGWRLVGVDGTAEAGCLVLGVVVRDDAWARRFTLVARSEGYCLWQRRPPQRGKCFRSTHRHEPWGHGGRDQLEASCKRIGQHRLS